MKSLDVKAENDRRKDEIRRFQALSQKEQAAEIRRGVASYPDGSKEKQAMQRLAEILEVRAGK